MQIKKTALKNIILDLLTILLPTSFVFLFVPFEETLLYNPDEGLELIKSLLVQKGYSLYSSIWSDQPPLYTWLLGIWHQIFPQTVVSARTLTIIFSITLLFLFRKIIVFYFNQATSIYAVFVLWFSSYFVKLSVAVMQAIPSLCLGICSLYLLIMSCSLRQYNKTLLALSGIFLGLAIQCKFWMIILIPVSLFTLSKDTSWRRILRSTNLKIILNLFANYLIWLVSLLATIIFIILLALPFPREQLLETHLRDQLYNNMTIFKMLSAVVMDDKAIFIFAFFSLLLAFKTNLNKVSIPLVWLISDFVIFWNHRPIWYHYYPIFAIPLVWLSSYLFWWAWSILTRKLSLSCSMRLITSNLGEFTKYQILLFALAVLVVGMPVYLGRGEFISYAYHHRADMWDRGSPEMRELISVISQYRDKTKWIYVDNPIIAVYADLLIPPEVAVVTKKRIKKDRDYEQQLLSVLQTYKPEQIIFTTFQDLINNNDRIKNYVFDRYRPIKLTQYSQHYLLKSIE